MVGIVVFSAAGRRARDAVIDIIARKRAEETEHYLGRASEVLASSLDYETTLEQLARIVVPDSPIGAPSHRGRRRRPATARRGSRGPGEGRVGERAQSPIPAAPRRADGRA
jgi:hypothetical protein